MSLAYVISSLLYSLVGFAVGIKYGQLQRKMSELEGRVMVNEETTASPAENPATPARPRHLGAVHLDSQRILGLVIVVMAMVSMAVSFYAAHQQNRITNCQTAYFGQYRESLLARDAASTVARANVRTYAIAEKDLWVAFLKNVPTHAGDQLTDGQRNADITALNHYLASDDAYVASLDAAGASAARFPLPTQACS